MLHSVVHEQAKATGIANSFLYLKTIILHSFMCHQRNQSQFHFTDHCPQKQNTQTPNSYIFLNMSCIQVNHSQNSKHFREPTQSINFSTKFLRYLYTTVYRSGSQTALHSHSVICTAILQSSLFLLLNVRHILRKQT